MCFFFFFLMQEVLIFFISFFVFLIVRKDFVTPVTPVMEGLVDLHDHIFYFLVLIFVFVFWLFVFLLRRFLTDLNYVFFFKNFFLTEFSVYVLIVLALLLNAENTAYGRSLRHKFELFHHFTTKSISFSVYRLKKLLKYRNYIHHELLEIIWTIIPAWILVLISIPSFALLYAMDELIEAFFVVKIVGYQWFWTYEYSRQESYSVFVPVEGSEEKRVIDFEHNTLNYSSIMLSEDDLNVGQQRLLEVDHELVLPSAIPVRLVITSGDVLHSWALPAFGVKVDAVPGRLSHVPLFVDYEGVYYGQCSELCGVGHAFMPIVVKIVGWQQFNAWYWSFFERKV